MLRDDCPCGADGFKLKKFWILPTVQLKTEKNASNTRANPPYHLILLLSNLISILWFSGYGAMMQIVRTEVRTPVSNTTENHYNFVVALPLVSLEAVVSI